MNHHFFSFPSSAPSSNMDLPFPTVTFKSLSKYFLFVRIAAKGANFLLTLSFFIYFYAIFLKHIIGFILA